MTWKKRAAGLMIAVGLLVGGGVVAAAPATAASCSSMDMYPINNGYAYRFTASCSGGAMVRSYVICISGTYYRTVTYPHPGESATWTQSCTLGVLDAGIYLLNP